MTSLGIGIIALSSPLAPELVQKASAFLEGQGHELYVPQDPSRYYGNYEHLFSAGGVEERLQHFYTLANNPKISLILLARGGYGSMELLESFRPNKIRRRSDLFVSGFSDASAILFALLARKHVHPLHGPTLSSFSASPDLALQHWKELQELMEPSPGILLPFGNEKLTLLCGPSEQIKGPLAGGNLTVLNALLGTPWAPKLGRAIFFFEDTGVKPYALHRMLLQFKIAGKFRSLAAVVVGDCGDCVHQDGKGPSVEDVLRDIFEPLRIPVYIRAPFGHAGRIAPLPLGRKANIVDGVLQLP